jgi:hypothetical protein
MLNIGGRHSLRDHRVGIHRYKRRQQAGMGLLGAETTPPPLSSFQCSLGVRLMPRNAKLGLHCREGNGYSSSDAGQLI